MCTKWAKLNSDCPNTPAPGFDFCLRSPAVVRLVGLSAPHPIRKPLGTVGAPVPGAGNRPRSSPAVTSATVPRSKIAAPLRSKNGSQRAWFTFWSGSGCCAPGLRWLYSSVASSACTPDSQWLCSYAVFVALLGCANIMLVSRHRVGRRSPLASSRLAVCPGRVARLAFKRLVFGQKVLYRDLSDAPYSWSG
jgi:hypothetical protein